MIITNRDAPMRKLIKVKFGKSEDSANWKVMIDHDPKKKLEAVIPFAGDKFMALFLEDVHVSCFLERINKYFFRAFCKFTILRLANLSKRFRLRLAVFRVYLLV